VVDFPTEDLKAYEEASRTGDALENLKRSGDFAVFVEKILEPLDRGAFEVFKKVDPEDTIGIIEAQQMSKMLDRIDDELKRMIQEGYYAKEQIKNSTHEQEDE